MILPAATFDALATLQAIHDERATAIYGVPTMFIAELEHPEFRTFDFSSLRTGMMAGAPCPVEIMKRVVSEMHCAGMTVGYGQTESSPMITMSAVDDSLERRVSTVGQACANTEVKIVSPSGETVPVGEQGELCTRGYLVMKGYDQELEATCRAIDEDGWLHTGDLATMDIDECFRITGRAKDMIIRAGENVYPREVEEFLHTHPKMAEVQVVGLPDARLGETVAAWIRLKEPAGEEEIREFCRGQDRAFQGSSIYSVRGCISDDGDGEGSEVSDSRDRDPGSRPGGRGADSDGVSRVSGGRMACLNKVTEKFRNLRRVFRRLESAIRVEQKPD